MIQRLEELRPGNGFLWAAGRLSRWIEAISPDDWEELLRLIQVAEKIGLSASDSSALGEEGRRIWDLYLEDIEPHRAVSHLYWALSALAAGNQQGFVQSSATALFIAAASENYTQPLLHELHESYRDLVS